MSESSGESFRESFDVQSVSETTDAIRWAAAEQVPLELVSGGTKRGLGNVRSGEEQPRRLNLCGLSGITLYEPEELVVTLKPGTPVRELAQALAAEGQQLAFEPPDWGPLYGKPVGNATVGGIVACNLSGPRRFVAGATRDHVLGLSSVSGRGEEFKCGGRVVKNVTGYDLCKVLTGSYGTLAAITELTLRVVPAPERTATIMVQGLDDARGIAALGQALGSSSEVSAAAYIPANVMDQFALEEAANGQAVTALRLEGPLPSIEVRQNMLRAMDAFSGQKVFTLDDEKSQEFWRIAGDVKPFADDPAGPLWRLSVPPAQGAKVTERISEQLKAQWFYDWAGGLIWLAVDGGAGDGGAAVVRSAVAEFGGHATLVRASTAIKSQASVFQPQAPALARLSAQMKSAFDPRNILNPGRMVPHG